MAVQTTSNLTNAIGTRYTQRYLRGVELVRIYDQLAMPIGASQADLESRRGLGTTYTFNFASDMTPGSTAVSESADVVPQVIVDATSTITPTSRGEALKWSELLDLEVYTDYVGVRSEILGRNAMETIDNLAKAAALQGSLKVPGTARASLDAGTATDTWTEAAMWKASTMVLDLKCPPFMEGNRQMYLAIAHPDAYYDLFHGGNVITAATYGGLPGKILFNGELGEIANFKLIISPWAKVFGAAGADNATDAAYVLTTANAALATSLAITTATNVASGRLLTVGTEETGNTFYDTNERVRHVSGTTTSVIVGSGANGGMRFAHALGTAVRNADSVYPVAYGTPSSLVKVFANEIGEFGQRIGPEDDGILHQWQQIAWKFYGGYGRVAENYILRGEYSSSLDA